MKTRPRTEVLPLPMEGNAQLVMEVYYDALHEMVCYGTHIFDWSLAKNNKTLETNTEIEIAPSLLFRHILELMDAISVQLKNGIAEPCKVHLRALLEAYFSLEYMLLEKTQERSACFFLVDFYRKLNSYKKLIPNTKENINYKKRLKAFSSDFGDIIDNKDATNECKNLQELIDKDQYKEVKEEYLRHTSNNTARLNNLKWYALFKGPDNIGQLAEHLKRLDLYDFFYKEWSSSTHGSELWTNTLTEIDDEYGAIKQIRNLERAHFVAEATIALGLHVYLLLADKYIIKHKSNIQRWGSQFERNHFSKVKNTRLLFGKTKDY